MLDHKPFKSLEEVFQKYSTIKRTPVKAVRSERAELIGYFLQRLNQRQLSEQKRPYHVRQIAVKLAHLSVKDLYFLRSICEDSDNWYRTFWGSLKIKKVVSQD